MSEWLDIRRGDAPLVVSIPHSGTDIPADLQSLIASTWLARKDTDWWIHILYDFASGLDATVVRTRISRTVIDVNRDPSGTSLYPGQVSTDLCPATTFDGEPLYRRGRGPDSAEIQQSRLQFFEPYHTAIAEELSRLRSRHDRVVLYDAHSIRSRVPRLFEGLLPVFNIGTHSGSSCDEALTRAVEQICDHTAFSRVTNGRFKGGWTTRHYGTPDRGIHALQMELACRAYLNEPTGTPSPANWPPPYDAARAASLRPLLIRILNACIDFGRSRLS